jgi:hypothetical protein
MVIVGQVTKTFNINIFVVYQAQEARKKNLCVYRNIFIQPPVVAGRVNRGQGARPWLVVANWNMIAMSISSCILILPAEVRGRRHRN